MSVSEQASHTGARSCSRSSRDEDGGQQMAQQDHWQAHPSNERMPGRSHYPSMGADDSSTFVNPLHEGSSQSFSPYTFAPETAIPPPPPGMDSLRLSQPKTSRGYQIALAVLTLLVVVLGSLEVVQLAAHTLLTTYPSGSTGSNQAGISPAQHTTSPFYRYPNRLSLPAQSKRTGR